MGCGGSKKTMIKDNEKEKRSNQQRNSIQDQDGKSTVRLSSEENKKKLEKQKPTSKVSPIIALHLGGFGIRCGMSYWEVQCLKNMIDPKGGLMYQIKENGENTSDPPEIFFNETYHSTYTPRAIFADTDCESIDEINAKELSQLFSLSSKISNQRESGTIAINYSWGKEVVSRISEQMRKEVEKCESSPGFMVFSSAYGGSGTGLKSKVIREIDTAFPKAKVIGISLFPSPSMRNTSLEAYNTIYGLYDIDVYENLSYCFDNESLYRYAVNELQISSPSYMHNNNIIAQIATLVNYSSNEKNCIDMEYNIRMLTKSSKRLHYISSGILAENTKIISGSENNISEIFKTSKDIVRNPNTRLISLSLSHSTPSPRSTYLAMNLIIRGLFNKSLVSKNNIEDILSSISPHKSSSVFYSTFLHSPVIPIMKTKQIDFSDEYINMIHLDNFTGISNVFRRICADFDQMYKKKASVFRYLGEAFEELEFKHSRDLAQEIIEEYKSIELS